MAFISVPDLVLSLIKIFILFPLLKGRTLLIVHHLNCTGIWLIKVNLLMLCAEMTLQNQCNVVLGQYNSTLTMKCKENTELILELQHTETVFFKRLSPLHPLKRIRFIFYQLLLSPCPLDGRMTLYLVEKFVFFYNYWSLNYIKPSEPCSKKPKLK